jgi:Xaa-Pro aminopeptidase
VSEGVDSFQKDGARRALFYQSVDRHPEEVAEIFADSDLDTGGFPLSGQKPGLSWERAASCPSTLFFSLALAMALALPLPGCASPAPEEGAPLAVGSGGGTFRTPEECYLDWARPTFPKEEHATRRERMAGLLRSSGDVFLVPSLPGRSGGETFRQLDDFLYFTGLELPDAMLVIDGGSGESTVFAPGRDARFESATRPNDFPGRPLADDPAIAAAAGIGIRPIEELEPLLLEWVRSGRTLRVRPARAGELEEIETSFTGRPDPVEVLRLHLVRIVPDARVASAHDEVARLRMVKSQAEIAVIRRAVSITAESMREAARDVRPGVTERDLEAVLEAAFKRGGAQRPAFDSIIKSGENSLWPWRILAAHSDRRNRALEKGDLVIFDVGCELDHYASDVGRTFPASGKFTEAQARALRLSTAVADAVMAAVRPGITFSELKEIAVLATPEGKRHCMQTGLFFGHHIGLDVGDPSLDIPLEPGMVFTIEPWYYDHEEGIAVFVEDDVLVTANGVENLTRGLPRRIEELEAMTGGGGW